MSIFDTIVTKIIKEQELIIGPIAWIEATKVSGVYRLDQNTAEVSPEAGDPKIVVDALVVQYAHLFGEASRAASKDSVASLLADLDSEQIPSSLQ